MNALSTHFIFTIKVRNNYSPDIKITSRNILSLSVQNFTCATWHFWCEVLLRQFTLLSHYTNSLLTYLHHWHIWFAQQALDLPMSCCTKYYTSYQVTVMMLMLATCVRLLIFISSFLHYLKWSLIHWHQCSGSYNIFSSVLTGSFMLN